LKNRKNRCFTRVVHVITKFQNCSCISLYFQFTSIVEKSLNSFRLCLEILLDWLFNNQSTIIKYFNWFINRKSTSRYPRHFFNFKLLEYSFFDTAQAIIYRKNNMNVPRIKNYGEKVLIDRDSIAIFIWFALIFFCHDEKKNYIFYIFALLSMKF
jgi:hypothetical protein